jgi:hypothetical protein
MLTTLLGLGLALAVSCLAFLGIVALIAVTTFSLSKARWVRRYGGERRSRHPSEQAGSANRPRTSSSSC